VQVTSEGFFWFCFWQNDTLQRHAIFFYVFVLGQNATLQRQLQNATLQRHL